MKMPAFNGKNTQSCQIWKAESSVFVNAVAFLAFSFCLCLANGTPTEELGPTASQRQRRFEIPEEEQNSLDLYNFLRQDGERGDQVTNEADSPLATPDQSPIKRNGDSSVVYSDCLNKCRFELMKTFHQCHSPCARISRQPVFKKRSKLAIAGVPEKRANDVLENEIGKLNPVPKKRDGDESVVYRECLNECRFTLMKTFHQCHAPCARISGQSEKRDTDESVEDVEAEVDSSALEATKRSDADSGVYKDCLDNCRYKLMKTFHQCHSPCAQLSRGNAFKKRNRDMNEKAVL